MSAPDPGGRPDLSRRALLFGRAAEPLVPEPAPGDGLFARLRRLLGGAPEEARKTRSPDDADNGPVVTSQRLENGPQGRDPAAADGAADGRERNPAAAPGASGPPVSGGARPREGDPAAAGPPAPDRAQEPRAAPFSVGEVVVPPEIADRAARFRAEMANRPRKPVRGAAEGESDGASPGGAAAPGGATPDGASAGAAPGGVASPVAPAGEAASAGDTSLAAMGPVNWLLHEPRATHPGVPLLRPPGAVEEAAFLAKCTRCGDCAPACPHDAITFVHPRVPGAAGTPIIDPAIEACRMCPDMPCAAACGPAVLRPDLSVKMGTAQIQTFSCLNTLGGFCSVCVERCPVPGAIRLDGRRVVVDADACTGCGICAYACPAPGTAILVLPEPNRPEWTDRSAP